MMVDKLRLATVSFIAACLAVVAVASFAYAEPEQSYRLTWGDYVEGNGGIVVEDGSGVALLPGDFVSAGTEITVSFTPEEGYVLWNAFAYRGFDPSLTDMRVDSALSLSENSLTFTMPSEDVSLYCAFGRESGFVTHSMGPHGHFTITNEAGEEVGEAKPGDLLTVTYAPASGYRVDSAMLVQLVPPYDNKWTNLPIVDGKSTFEMPLGNVSISATFVRTDGKYEVFSTPYMSGGKIAVQDKKGNEAYFFKPGSAVYVSLNADEGYAASEPFANNDLGEMLDLKLESDGRYSFEMPESDVWVYGDFSPSNGGTPIFLQECLYSSESSWYVGDLAYGDAWLEDSDGERIAGQVPGEDVKVCVSLNDDKHFVREVRYQCIDDSEGAPEWNTVANSSTDDGFVFTMPQGYVVNVEVIYERYDDGLHDIIFYSPDVGREDLAARITYVPQGEDGAAAVGEEISAAAADKWIRFEYLNEGEYTLSYMGNYFDPEAKDVTCIKQNHNTYDFMMPEGPLYIEILVERIDVRAQTDDSAYIPKEGRDEARLVAQGLFKKLVETGEVPKGMQKRSAEAFRNMIKGADGSGLYVGMVVKAKDSSVSDAERLLLLEVTESDELIVHTFDLSVEFGMTTGNGYSSSAELTELVEGIQFQLMPDGADSKFVRIVRIHDGAVEDVPVIEVDEDGYLIDADRFSTYSVLAADTTTVSFESNGGSAVAPQEVGYGQKLAKPADPTREGYVFEGWYADEAQTVAYDFEEPVVQHLGTLYAKWSADGSGSTTGAGGEGGSAGTGQSSGDSIAKTGDGSGLTVALLGFGVLVAAGAIAVARRRMKQAD